MSDSSPDPRSVSNLTDRDLLISLRERVNSLERSIERLGTETEGDIEGVKEQVRERMKLEVQAVMNELVGLRNAILQKVSQDQFRPVQIIAYGIATAAMGGVLSALISQVLIPSGNPTPAPPSFQRNTVPPLIHPPAPNVQIRWPSDLP